MVTIVIVNWNSKNYLRECVASIQDYHCGLVSELVIVDNASEDDSYCNLSINIPVRLIRNHVNKGFAAACNQGYNLVKTPYFLLLNPDTRLHHKTLAHCYKLMVNTPRITILGVRHIDEYNVVQPSCSRFPTTGDFIVQSLGLHQLLPSVFRSPILKVEQDYDLAQETEQVMGAFMFIRTEAVAALDCFMDERFFVYMEDLDFSKRVRDNGGISFYEPTISVFHKGNGTTDQIRALRLVYAIESRFKYLKKHFVRPSFWFVAFVSLIFEPVCRIANLMLKKRFAEGKEVVQAYIILLKRGLLRVI